MPTGEAAGGKSPTKHPLTALEGRKLLAEMRPSVSARIDLARARGKAAAGTQAPSRMPSAAEHGFSVFVGNVGHAKDLGVLKRLGIGAVLNCAPAVCKDPVKAYRAAGITCVPTY